MNNAEVVNLEPLDRIARLASQNGQEDVLQDWGEILQRAILPTRDFHALDLPERKPIVAPWFLEGDLGFIFGPRGLGKTWLAMELAIRISEGSMAGLWNVPQPRRVLYVDGEMPYDASRSRQLSLAKGEGEMLFLHHEALFHQSGETLNLTSRSIQSSLGDYCTARDVEVVFLDNLSCLFSGVKENDADSWEVIQRWLLELRRRRKPRFNIGVSTGVGGDPSGRWHAAYLHWRFMPSEVEYRGELTKGRKKKGPTQPT